LPTVSKDRAAPHARPWFVLREPQDARALPALLTIRAERLKISLQRYWVGSDLRLHEISAKSLEHSSGSGHTQQKVNELATRVGFASSIIDQRVEFVRILTICFIRKTQ
jgi:hypothetical protein